MTANIVTTLLVNSIVFSGLFLFLLILRKLLSVKISALMQYALLAVVVLKLLIPFGFVSAISPLGWLKNNATLAEAAQGDAEQPEPFAYTGAGQTLGMHNKVTPSAQTPLTDKADTQASQTKTTQIPHPAEKTILHWSAWVCIVWLIGALAMALWLSLSLQNMHRRIRHARTEVPEHILIIFEACKKELGIKGRIGLVMQTAIPVPTVTGILRPRLIMPDSIIDKESTVLRNIFLHELTHYKHGDLVVIGVMNFLNCLYWFNPLVWLCFKLMRSDMETICDQRCLRMMTKADQSGYVATVLQFAGMPPAMRLQAAIAITDGRSNMEQRIRNMFKIRRTRGVTRILVILIAGIMLVTGVLTACQPTPEKAVVIGKGNDALESAVAATALPESSPVISEERTDNTSPTNMVLSGHWQDTLSENDVTINIDADVCVPNVSSYPVYEVAPYFTDETLARKFISVLAKDAVEIHNGAYSLPEDYERTILSLKKEKAELEAGKTGDDSITPIKEQIAAIDEQLKQVEQEYAESKKESDLIGQPLDFSFDGSHSQLVEDTDVLKDRTLQFTATMKDGSKRMLGFQNIQESTVQHTILYCLDPQAKRTYEAGNLPSTEEAVSAAMNIINELDIGAFDFKYERLEYGIDENTGQFVDEPNAKQLFFAKSYNGIPVNQYIGADNPACVPEDELVYNIVLRQEEISVTFNQDGMFCFSWDTPCKVLRTENENVAVISFDEAKDIFNQHVMYSIYPWEDRETKIDINEVRLGYMAIPVKDDLSSFRTIPVWDFIGADNTFGDEKYHHYDNQRSFVTINAIDGSVIDRNLGY